MVKVSGNLKKIRTAKGVTQDELAEKLNVTRQAVSNWENNKSLPDIHTLEAIAQALDVELEELVYGKKKEDISAQRITEEKQKSFKVIIAVFGGLSIAVGITILIVFFWKYISDFIKAPLAILPFLLGAALAVFVYLKKFEKESVRECAALMNIVGFTVSFFLVNEVYETVLDGAPLFLICTLVAVPVMFLMQSAVSLAAYYIFSIIWLEVTRFNYDGTAMLLIIPLFAVGAINCILFYKRSQDKQHIFASWITVIAACIITFISFDYGFLADLSVYVVLAAGLYLIKNIKLISKTPLKVFGSGLTLIVGIFTMFTAGFGNMDGISDFVPYILALVFFGACIGIGFKSIRKNIYDMIFAAVIILKIALMIIYELLPESASEACYEIYRAFGDLTMFGLDFLFIFSGIKELDSFKINIGIISAYIMIASLSYYYIDVNFWIVGLFCIAFGVSLFVANLLMSSKKRAVKEEAAHEE